MTIHTPESNPENSSATHDPFPNPLGHTIHDAISMVRSQLHTELIDLESKLGLGSSSPIIKDIEAALLKGGNVSALFAELHAIQAKEGKIEGFILAHNAQTQDIACIVAGVTHNLGSGEQCVDAQSVAVDTHGCRQHSPTFKGV